ncbi:LCP family protein [Patescibacteria group bacterium]|nr:LCP family protein [Patescibacteria group bacterium]MBU1703408.1 LCP family protein [Patescibacteria group bacterium]MBU1953859.1 LCP family protein [Patescibacteria group bacterium]
MIFANIDPIKRKITLISLPRDLYYNGRKINSIYRLYGMDELKRTLSFISGYKIDRYILIDMYAFMDVIDMIGGIDVHLDQAVIDPTYKTFDGGEWGTLYYRAGDHHLSGKQALRLARTRHTSSDFARSERQHLILEAIQTKALNFGFGDAESLKSMAEVILSRTETDINLAEAISYFFRYQSFKINGGYTVSSGNVLVSKYTGDLKREEYNCEEVEEQNPLQETLPAPLTAVPSTAEKSPPDPCANIEKGEYILLPHGDDWNTIRVFFNKIIEQGA